MQQGTGEEKLINRINLLVSISFVFALLLTTASVVQQRTGEVKCINWNEWKFKLLVSISFVLLHFCHIGFLGVECMALH